MSGVTNPRVLFAAGVLGLAVVVSVVLMTGADGGSTTPDEPDVLRATLRLELATRPNTGGRELLVSLPGPQLNNLSVTGGARLVWLRCLDRNGRTIIRQPINWPLVEEDGYPPHLHQPADQPLLDSVQSCRLTGPGIDYNGLVPGRFRAK